MRRIDLLKTKLGELELVFAAIKKLADSVAREIIDDDIHSQLFSLDDKITVGKELVYNCEDIVEEMDDGEDEN